MTETEQLADIIALSVHAATEPLLAKIAALEARPLGYGSKDAWDAIADTLSDLRVRMVAVEARALVPGPAGPQGPQGEPGQPGAVGAVGPAGKDGLNGQDGAQGLPGKDGAAGINGQDGSDGLHGKDGLSVVDALLTKDGQLTLTFSDGSVRTLGTIRGEPEDYLTTINERLTLLEQKERGLDGQPGPQGPEGKPGRDGRDGQPGVPGPPGENGVDGTHGKDGATGLNGQDGADGAHGKDGLGFEDLTVIFDDTKGWVLRFVRGDQQKDFPIPLPFDAGIWQFGKRYPKAAGVTVKGAFWIAQEATTTRPGDGTPESAKAWRLAVKGGRDGKPGKDGRDGIDA